MNPPVLLKRCCVVWPGFKVFNLCHFQSDFRSIRWKFSLIRFCSFPNEGASEENARCERNARGYAKMRARSVSQGRQGRSARTVQPGQYSQGRTARAGQPGQYSQGGQYSKGSTIYCTVRAISQGSQVRAVVGMQRLCDHLQGLPTPPQPLAASLHPSYMVAFVGSRVRAKPTP